MKNMTFRINLFYSEMNVSNFSSFWHNVEEKYPDLIYGFLEFSMYLRLHSTGSNFDLSKIYIYNTIFFIKLAFLQLVIRLQSRNLQE